MIRRTLCLIVSLAGLAFASSCSGSSGRSSQKSYAERYREEAFGSLTLTDREALEVEYVTEAESLTSVCMKNAGFHYVPWVSSTPGSSFDRNRREERAKRGFGLLLVQNGGEARDPNADSYFAMTPAQQSSYDAAMGRSGGGLSGCYPSSYESARQKLGITRINALVKTVYDRIAGDPRIVAAQSTWSSCVKSAGYGNFATEDQLIQSLRAESNNTKDPALFAKHEIEVSLMSFDCGGDVRSATKAARDAVLKELGQ
jgi:hypothetical protein